MKIKKIIIHHSLTADNKRVSWGAIREYHIHTKGWKDIGYQYGIELVDNYYEILVGRFEDEVGAHTVGMNSSSIGICMIGNFDIAEPPLEQWQRALDLVRSLLRRYSLKTDDVMCHRDYANYKSCPGTKFDMLKFRGQL